jgi:phosphoribosylcarboxyaminoimidazole (NCAIR) mutase
MKPAAMETAQLGFVMGSDSDGSPLQAAASVIENY